MKGAMETATVKTTYSTREKLLQLRYVKGGSSLRKVTGTVQPHPPANSYQKVRLKHAMTYRRRNRPLDDNPASSPDSGET